jgi:hypothetical protein
MSCSSLVSFLFAVGAGERCRNVSEKEREQREAPCSVGVGRVDDVAGRQATLEEQSITTPPLLASMTQMTM